MRQKQNKSQIEIEVTLKYEEDDKKIEEENRKKKYVLVGL